MKRIALSAFALVVGMASFVTAQQSSPDEPEWQKLARAEREKRLQKLYLSISAVGVDSNPRTEYRANESVIIRVGATNTSNETLIVTLKDVYQHYFPRLRKDGLLVPYSEKAKERLADTTEPLRSRVWGVKIEPQAEQRLALLLLSSWFDKLEPGVYQLTLQFALHRKDHKVETHPIMFEIVP